MTTATYLNHNLQALRDLADSASLDASNSGDRDSADAYERIGLEIAGCLDRIKHDLSVAEARVGLMENR